MTKVEQKNLLLIEIETEECRLIASSFSWFFSHHLTKISTECMALLNSKCIESRGLKPAIPIATLVNVKEFKVLCTCALITDHMEWVRLFDRIACKIVYGWLTETRLLRDIFMADAKDSDS